MLTDFSKGSELQSLSFIPDTLTVTINVETVVKFQRVLGFRVLNESDLLEFWPACSATNGALFEILDGGWLSQESARPGFVSKSQAGVLKEYLLSGPENCVNVLAFENPRVTSRAL